MSFNSYDVLLAVFYNIYNDDSCRALPPHTAQQQRVCNKQSVSYVRTEANETWIKKNYINISYVSQILLWKPKEQKRVEQNTPSGQI